MGLKPSEFKDEKCIAQYFVYIVQVKLIFNPSSYSFTLSLVLCVMAEKMLLYVLLVVLMTL